MDTKAQQLMQRVKRIEIKTRTLSKNIFAGQYHSAFKGRGMSFSEVREYQSGDDVRDIDWNVSARFNHTYIKVYEEERELTVMLIVDISASLDFGSQGQTQREQLTEIAATIAFSAIRNNDKIGVLFFSDRIEKFVPPAKGKGHILRIIRELLTIEPVGKRTNIGTALEYFLRIMPRRSVVFLLSDFISSTNDYSRLLHITRQKHDLVAVQVYDSRMVELPNVGLLKIEDAETGYQTYIDTSSSKVREVQKAWWSKRNHQLKTMLQCCNIKHTTIATNADYVQQLKLLFTGKTVS